MRLLRYGCCAAMIAEAVLLCLTPTTVLPHGNAVMVPRKRHRDLIERRAGMQAADGDKGSAQDV